jgi:antitoxin component YwqK of YwqJK toxin-antitoxin module
MNFEVTNGLGQLSIRISEIGSYFHFKKPLSTVWYDCRGSLGKYLCSLPHEPAYREEIRKRILLHLDVDYTNKTEELYQVISPLLQLFSNGKYSLGFYHSLNNKYFEYTSSRDNFTVIHQYDWCLLFSNATRLQDKETKIAEYEALIQERASKQEATLDILDFTTASFYDANSRCFIATQTRSEINEERVKYFESQILNGKRSAAIIFNCMMDYGDLRSADYVLDGHHKLLAYYNLKIAPSLIVITRLPDTRQEVEFNMEELIEVLYPWQVEHILQNWEEKDYYISDLLSNPVSKIHQFVKNGHHQVFHKNGQLKHEAFYVNDKVEGEARWWFDNGQLEQIKYFKNGLSVGIWKRWYKSGQVQSIHPFNEQGQLHGHTISYYENGQVWLDMFLKEGIHINGYSHTVWQANGFKKAELKYMNGQVIEHKIYNQYGELISFSEFDFKEQKLVQRL